MFAFGSYFLVINYVMATIPKYVEIDKELEETFYNYILVEHNNYRRIHDSPDLKIDLTYSIQAYHYLNKMLFIPFNPNLLPTCGLSKFSRDFKHVPRLNAKLANEIVKSWYEKGANYNYLEEPKNSDADAFTQIVWKSTTLLGVKMKMTEEGNLHIVVTYSEKGNIKEKYLDNVKKPEKPENVFGNLLKWWNYFKK